MIRKKKAFVTPVMPQKPQCQSAEVKPVKSITQDTFISKPQAETPSVQSTPLTK